MKGFRLSRDVITALDQLADKSGHSRTHVLEYLIEQEYRRRVEAGQIPPDQNLFDLFGPDVQGDQDDKG